MEICCWQNLMRRFLRPVSAVRPFSRVIYHREKLKQQNTTIFNFSSFLRMLGQHQIYVDKVSSLTLYCYISVEENCRVKISMCQCSVYF